MGCGCGCMGVGVGVGAMFVCVCLRMFVCFGRLHHSHDVPSM